MPSTSSSNYHTRTLKSPKAFLTIPQDCSLRRASFDSTFSGSEISELTFGSTEFANKHGGGLLRTLSNVSSNLAGVAGPTTWRTKVQAFWVANYGAFLVLISQIFGCMMNIATRLLETPGSHGEPMHPFQILFARQSITVLITTTYALWSKSIPHFPLGPPGKVRLLLIARGLFGFLGVFGLYFSLLYLPISEATILTFLAPIGSCYAFSLLLPDETFSKQQQIAGFVSLFGVVFIARPVSLFSGGYEGPMPNPEISLSSNATTPATEIDGVLQPTSAQHLKAVGIAMIGVVGAIGAMTSIRSIGTRAHALLSVNYFSAWCTFVSLMALLVVPSVEFRLPGNIMEWGLLSLLGCCGFIMQLLLTQGMAYGTAGNSEKQTSRTTNDVEMQVGSADPQASVLLARSDVASGLHNKTHSTKPIKGSGAKATSMLYTQMLFALIADKIVFDVTPDPWSWAGSGLILFGAIWVAADGSKTAKPPMSPAPVLAEQQPSRHKVPHASHEEEVGLLTDTEDVQSSRHEIRDQRLHDSSYTNVA